MVTTLLEWTYTWLSMLNTLVTYHHYYYVAVSYVVDFYDDYYDDGYDDEDDYNVCDCVMIILIYYLWWSSRWC